MGLENADEDLAAHYNCKPEQLLEENMLLWEIVIELIKAVHIHDPAHTCPKLHGFSADKLQVLQSYLRLKRYVQ